MKTRQAFRISLALVLLLLLAVGLGQAQGPEPEGVQPDASVGTGFTYQGRLRDGGGSPITSTCDFAFGLWDAEGGGTQVGSDSLVSGVSVADGYFAALVNAGGEFGASAFAGEARWLQIAVQCTGDPGYTTLSPRQALTAAPYALSLRPGAVISGAVAGGSGLQVTNSAGSGTTYGLYGRADSTAGRGVYGYATATSGTNYGLYGRSESPDGYGVAGWNIAASGTAHGLFGRSDSPDGCAVYGRAAASYGTNFGVAGESNSTAGRGVAGIAAASSGETIGVAGESNSTDGRGVNGYANATSGTTFGVRGTSTSPEGLGVAGYATAASGTNYGVYGRSASPDGRGVFGFATATSGENYGVRGVSQSPDGYGVFGWASATTDGLGSSQGVYGRSDAPSGRGLDGMAAASVGTNYGVRGVTQSPDGHGGYFVGRLYAEATINATATPENHVAQFYNTSTGSSPDVLALKVGYAADPDEGINFITFFHGSDIAVGAIEGDGAGGVTYKSGSADYAEYLPRRNPREDVGPGDVVGVYGGQVSKATRGADQVLVVSSAPLLLGNDPGGEDAAGYEKVAFLGQVQVQVRGPVAVGDLLVPSGLEDGTAIAVAPGEITTAQLAQVLGQAWESSAEEGVKPVQAAVGLPQQKAAVDWMASRVLQLAEENGRLRGQVGDLAARVAALEGDSRDGVGSVRPLLNWAVPGTVMAGLIVAVVWQGRRRGR